jgi:hypothetical protein
VSKSNVQGRNEERLTTFFNTMLEELLAVEPQSFAVSRQVQRARKRARFLREDLRGKAVDDFLLVNERVRVLQNETPPSLVLDPRIVNNARLYITTVLERYTTSWDAEAVQTPLEMSFLWSNWRYGPGASNGIRGTHAADKIWQDMTCTALCEPLVRKLRSMNPYFLARDGRKGVSGTTVVDGSRLTTVPKNEDTERTIAIEPSGNMCLQLAAGMYLEGALRYIGLDIRNQSPKNMEMAKRGSSDGSVATLDLKSASDMISIDLVRALMPREWFDLLIKLRSPTITVNRDGKSADGGVQVELHMISTMGNGFTFPLMTLLIVALIYGFRCTRGGPNLFVNWADTCVFGDDIIIPTHEYEGFVDVLTKAGLVVNLDKSFSAGAFRESCGGDYLNGVDVTPFYAKSLAVEPDIYVVINQLAQWSAREGILMHKTFTLLRSYIDGKPHLVPEWLNPDQGILTTGCPRRYTYLTLAKLQHQLPKEAECFAMPLVCGGYMSVAPIKPDAYAYEAPGLFKQTHKYVYKVGDESLFYLPRSSKMPIVRTRRSRLPQGYLDGWDPGYRSQQDASWIAGILAIHFSI